MKIYDIEAVMKVLKKDLTNKRFIHSKNVMNMAGKLAKKNGYDVEKAKLAGLLHDCARYMQPEELFDICGNNGINISPIEKKQPYLLHAAAGMILATQKYGIYDMEMLNAIRYHTTGREDMGLLEKIVFTADYIEPGRKYPGVAPVRDKAFRNLDEAICDILDATIGFIIKKNNLLHEDTVRARNYFLL